MPARAPGLSLARADEDDALIVEAIALGLSLLALGVALAGWRQARRAGQESEAKAAALQGQLESLRKQMMELHSGAIGMGQRLQGVETLAQQLGDRQQELTLQDPDRRLYSRAAKMVELGADLDEVMNECELPKAEAELLISLRKGRP